jgi:hypothetical protein
MTDTVGERVAQAREYLTGALLLDDVAGCGQVGDDAVGAALGDAQAGREVAQPHARVVGDAQQHPGVVGQEAPVRHARELL